MFWMSSLNPVVYRKKKILILNIEKFKFCTVKLSYGNISYFLLRYWSNKNLILDLITRLFYKTYKFIIFKMNFRFEYKVFKKIKTSYSVF